MSRRAFFTFATLVTATAPVAHAAVTIDGTRDADYGPAITVQQNPTGFGDANSGNVGTTNGSELDAGYATVSGGTLYLFLAGNLETNFNKLDIFIDSHAGGMNRLAALPVNQGNFNNMAGDGTNTGLRFDAPFAADHWISATAGGATPDIFVDYANLNTSVGNYAGQTTPVSNGALTGGNGGPASLRLTFNNSNTTGVTGTTAPNDAASVPTGIELAISLADLGVDSGVILVSAFINNGDHNYLSNQVLGGLPAGTGNLGGEGTGIFTGSTAGVDFQQFAGSQYFRIAVPEPASLALASLAALPLLRRRSR